MDLQADMIVGWSHLLHNYNAGRLPTKRLTQNVKMINISYPGPMKIDNQQSIIENTLRIKDCGELLLPVGKTLVMA